ncbi:MAG: D-serine ammonia-lyase, partial [Lentilactobacillus parabuchneri]
DPTIYKYEAQLMDTEHITVEPSAAAGFTAIERAITEVPDFNSENATHIVWATGGSMMPESERRVDHAKGEALLKS